MYAQLPVSGEIYYYDSISKNNNKSYSTVKVKHEKMCKFPLIKISEPNSNFFLKFISTSVYISLLFNTPGINIFSFFFVSLYQKLIGSNSPFCSYASPCFFLIRNLTIYIIYYLIDVVKSWSSSTIFPSMTPSIILLMTVMMKHLSNWLGSPYFQSLPKDSSFSNSSKHFYVC